MNYFNYFRLFISIKPVISDARKRKRERRNKTTDVSPNRNTNSKSKKKRKNPNKENYLHEPPAKKTREVKLGVPEECERFLLHMRHVGQYH